jgi:uncharacterized protein (TIGR00725 family)
MRDYTETPASHPFIMRHPETIRQTLHFLRHGRFDHPGPSRFSPERRLIAVLGSGGTADPTLLRIARETGTALARAGYGVVCGNLGGVFRAAFEGARKAGGDTIAYLTEPAVPDEAPCARAHTGLGETKHAAVAEACAGAVIIEGFEGTRRLLEEILKRGKPVVAMAGTGGLADACLRDPPSPPLAAPPPGAATPAEAVVLLDERLAHTRAPNAAGNCDCPPGNHPVSSGASCL